MLALLTLAASTLCACTPAPAPSPTPTAAFANEEEAFAAAEEVYRAYNDSSNEGSGASDFLTGAALESDLEAQRYLKQNELSLHGDSVIVSFNGTDSTLGSPTIRITAQVCLDVSQSRVLDAQGTDVTPEERADRWSLDITFVGTADELSISDSTAGDNAC